MTTTFTTRVTQHIRAPRARVYRAVLDAKRIAEWKVPDGMTAQVHEFDAHNGGRVRVSLTYDSPERSPTRTWTDTYHGCFVKVVPNEEIVEIVEFETADPALQGEMTITIRLVDANGGTDLIATHERLPRGVSPVDNEKGWRMSLAKLAAMVEKDAE